MEFEIMEKTEPVSFEAATVNFPAYDDYLAKAEDIAAQIMAMDVTPETVKEAKETLAEARKVTDRLTRARIDIKKYILKNYSDFEDQVRTIVSVIGDADESLRSKVKELEEAEREMKKSLVTDIWDKRIQGYPFVSDCIPETFDKWFNPKFLNKTMSLKKIESDLVLWLEKTNRELGEADTLGDEYLAAYITTGNLADAIASVKEQNEINERITMAKAEDDTSEEKACFVIYGKKDIKLTESLLLENEIVFERK